MRKIVVVMLAGFSMMASAQMLQTKTYATTGHPAQALATPEGRYVLVTVDSGRGPSGIDVFQAEGDTLKRVGFQPLGPENAQGIVLIPQTQTLAVGLSNAGVAFLPLDDALRGKAKVYALAQGEQSGSGYLAVTPDGQFLFVANEYGDGGNVGVIALHRDATGTVRPETLTHVPTRRATPGVTISPDGTTVYAVSEIVPPEVAARLPGHGAPELDRTGCMQRISGRTMPNGALYTIDAAKVEMLNDASDPEARRGAVRVMDAGCSPVRSAVTADGATLYVTARGDNRVLVFDTKMLKSDPQHALLRTIPTGGEAPVGLRLFDDDKALLVANSNRFAGGAGNATVFDLSDPAKPTRRQTIKTGEFPRNITASPDGKTLYMTVFLGDELMVLRER